MDQSTVNLPAAQAAPSPADVRDLAFAHYMNHQGRAHAAGYVLLLLDDVQTGTRTLESVMSEMRATSVRDQAAADAHFAEATRVSL